MFFKFFILAWSHRIVLLHNQLSHPCHSVRSRGLSIVKGEGGVGMIACEIDGTERPGGK